MDERFIKINQNSLTCTLCNVSVANKVSMSQHLLGQGHKKKLKNNSTPEDQNGIEQNCGIFVKDYPDYLGQDAILSHFSNFGEIVQAHFGYNFVLIDFSTPLTVEKIMKQSHTLGGRLLTVRHRYFKSKKSSHEISPEENTAILEQLKKLEFLYQQVQVFGSFLQGQHISEMHQFKNRRICADIYEAIRFRFPHCNIYPFGSSLTGLFFWHSDVDIYISGVRKEHEKDIGYLFRLKELLVTSSKFTNLIVIGQAKIPILKCVHLATKTSCDINIRNSLGVCNSRLISYYIGIEPKIRDMMMIIKYWASIHRITGQNHLFTNYSLCLMVIFYLQGNPYNLPSVKYLQTDGWCKILQGKWNGGFKTVTAYCPKVRSSTLLDLLCNFFSYYEEFDFNTNMICPYLGKMVNKKDFRDTKNLSDDFKAYKEYLADEENPPLKVDASVCVQDPFEHIRNTTSVISDSTLSIFVKFCRLAKKICEEGEKSILYKLFTQSPPNVDVTLLTQTNFVQFGVTMGINMNYLRNKLDENISDSKDALKQLWFDSVNNFVVIVLRDFLKFKVEELGEPSGSKQQKIDRQSDVHSKMGLVIESYKCSSKINLWSSRGIARFDAGKKFKNIIEKETEITKQLLNIYKDIELKVDIIEFKMVLEKKLEPPQVVFNLTKIDAYKKNFKSFGEFFGRKFVSWFEMYEKDMNSKKE